MDTFTDDDYRRLKELDDRYSWRLVAPELEKYARQQGVQMPSVETARRYWAILARRATGFSVPDDFCKLVCIYVTEEKRKLAQPKRQ